MSQINKLTLYYCIIRSGSDGLNSTARVEYFQTRGAAVQAENQQSNPWTISTVQSIVTYEDSPIHKAAKFNEPNP